MDIWGSIKRSEDLVELRTQLIHGETRGLQIMGLKKGDPIRPNRHFGSHRFGHFEQRQIQHISRAQREVVLPAGAMCGGRRSWSRVSWWGHCRVEDSPPRTIKFHAPLQAAERLSRIETDFSS